MDLTRRDLAKIAALTGTGTALAACGLLGEECRPGPNPVPEQPRLPEWFERARAQAHTRLPLSSMVGRSNRAFEDFPEYIDGLGASVYTRHVKSRDEDPWWPTDVASSGALRSGGGRVNSWNGADRRLHRTDVPAGTNALRTISEQSADHDLTWIAYYTTEFDRQIALEHPEWVCRRPGGAPNNLAYLETMGTALDITSPYREIVAQRLAEVVGAGAKGIYIDRALIPPWGDASTWALGRYRQETGRQRKLNGDNGSRERYADWFAPRRYPLEDVRWYAWKCDKIAETIALWRDSIRAVDPESVLIVSASNLPALIRPDASTSWCREADSVKGETDLAIAPSRSNRVFLADRALPQPSHSSARSLGWSLTRDSADGRPFHIWSGANLPSTDLAQLWAAAVMGHGGVANLDIYEQSGSRPGVRPTREHTSPAAAKAVFLLGQQVSPFLAFTRPLRHAVIHVPERARNALLTETDGITAVARRVVLPCTGALDTLAAAGLSVGTVDDRQLASGLPPETTLLFLPLDDLTPRQVQSVRRFEADGGTVVRQSALSWDLPRSDASHRLKDQLDAPAARAAVRIDAQPRCHTTAFRLEDDDPTQPLNRLVVCVVHGMDRLRVSHGVESEPSGSPTSDDVPGTTKPTTQQGAVLSWRSDLVSGELSAYEVVSGQELDITDDGDRLSVRLPDFTHLACVVVGTC